MLRTDRTRSRKSNPILLFDLNGVAIRNFPPLGHHVQFSIFVCFIIWMEKKTTELNHNVFHFAFDPASLVSKDYQQIIRLTIYFQDKQTKT